MRQSTRRLWGDKGSGATPEARIPPLTRRSRAGACTAPLPPPRTSPPGGFRWKPSARGLRQKPEREVKRRATGGGGRTSCTTSSPSSSTTSPLSSGGGGNATAGPPAPAFEEKRCCSVSTGRQAAKGATTEQTHQQQRSCGRHCSFVHPLHGARRSQLLASALSSSRACPRGHRPPPLALHRALPLAPHRAHNHPARGALLPSAARALRPRRARTSEPPPAWRHCFHSARSTCRQVSRAWCTQGLVRASA